MIPYKAELRFLGLTLVSVLVVASIPLLFLNEYCKPERTEQANTAAHGTEKGQSVSTEDSPFFKLVQALVDAKEKQNQSADGHKQEGWWQNFVCEMKATEFFIAVFTAWLVIVGAWQGIHLKRTVDSAEDALTKLERPWLFVFDVERFQHFQQGLNGTVVGTEYKVANHGKIPAVIQEVMSGISSGATGPEVPLHSELNSWMRRGFVVAPLESYPGQEQVPGGMKTYVASSGEVIVDAAEGEDVFFWVIVRYHGTITRGHETSACWRLDRATNRLVQHGGDEYNYTT